MSFGHGMWINMKKNPKPIKSCLPAGKNYKKKKNQCLVLGDLQSSIIEP